MIKHVLILGAGYGGLTTAMQLQRELGLNEAKITLVNKHNYHYIATHLHQSAAGTANLRRIKVDLNELIDKQKINFIKAEVVSIDLKKEKKVFLNNGEELTFDVLVIALGSEVETYGIKGLAEYAFTIRSLNTVQLIKEHIEYMFAKYKAEAASPDYLTFIIGGAGFTGIEFVGELADRIPELCNQFEVNRQNVKIINIEASTSALPGFDPKLVEYAVKILKNKGVEFKMNAPIQEVNQNGVILASGEEIKAKTVVWTGGVRGNEIIENIGIETQNARVKVDKYLRVPGFNNVFIIGDNSIVYDDEGKPFPATAQMAIQQGEHTARQIIPFIRDDEFAFKIFKFSYKGTLASIGKGVAVGKIGKWKVAGFTASFMKHMVDNRYLYSIGGIPLVLKKGKIVG